MKLRFISFSVLFEFPVLVVKRACLEFLKPSGDAVEMESMVARSPSHIALFGPSFFLVGLALNAVVHEVVPTNCARILFSLPFPHGHGVPLLDHKLILFAVNFHQFMLIITKVKL